MSVFWASAAVAQQGGIQPADTINAIRVATTVSVAQPDTVRVRFIPALGRLAPQDTTHSPFHFSNIVWTDARFLGDLLWKTPGVSLSTLGEPGKPYHLAALGLLRNPVTILVDGRPLAEPITGSFNLYDIPLEAIERVEVLRGSQSAAFGGSSGLTLNLVTHHYNTARPVTKIRYLQGPYEYSLLDGLFTQNVADATNLQLGFQRHVSDGRFANARFDAWNVRTKLRYNVTDRWNVSLSHSYNRSVNGLNGGIDDARSPSPFDDVTAVVKNPNASERISRNDLAVHTIVRLFSDSASTTQAVVYFSEIEREYRDRAGTLSFSNVMTSSLAGARVLQQLTGSSYSAMVGGDFEQRRMFGGSALGFRSEQRSAFFAHGAVSMFDILTPSLGIRREQQGGAAVTSAGASVRVRIHESTTLQAEAVRSERLPSWVERYAVPPILPSFEKHSTISIGGTTSPLSGVSLTGEFYTRRTDDAIQLIALREGDSLYFVVRTLPQIDARGASITASLAVWKVEATASVGLTDLKHGSVTKTLLPRLNSVAEVTYRDIVGAVEGRVGFRTHMASRHRGLQYHPELRMFYENSGEQVGGYVVVDLFGVFKLGDAYITVGWDNILNSNYLTTRFYPMPNRGFKLGVNWVFVD
jgi:outer membrane cobalamin receptor